MKCYQMFYYNTQTDSYKHKHNNQTLSIYKLSQHTATNILIKPFYKNTIKEL